MIQSMAHLVRSFPTLNDAKGIDPWDVDQFLRWALLDHRGGSGAAHAIRFILSLQNPRTDWAGYLLSPSTKRWTDQTIYNTASELRRRERASLMDSDEKSVPADAHVEASLVKWLGDFLGPFSVAAAFCTWDDAHRRAFRLWAEDGYLAERIEERAESARKDRRQSV